MYLLLKTKSCRRSAGFHCDCLFNTFMFCCCCCCCNWCWSPAPPVGRCWDLHRSIHHNIHHHGRTHQILRTAIVHRTTEYYCRVLRRITTTSRGLRGRVSTDLFWFRSIHVHTVLVWTGRFSSGLVSSLHIVTTEMNEKTLDCLDQSQSFICQLLCTLNLAIEVGEC